MQAQARRTEVSEETLVAFKRHILLASKDFASEPMADLYRVNLLSEMLERYDALRGRGLGDLSSQSRTMDEFDDIAVRMREMGFAEIETAQHAADEKASRRLQLSEAEIERFMRESDDYLHRQAMGAGLCGACVTPLMIANAFSETFYGYSNAFAMLGLVGMFAMIGMGVYAMTTAVKPQKLSLIKKAKFALSSRMRRKLSDMREEIDHKARKRRGRGVAMLATCVLPIFIGAALSEMEMTYSDFFPMIGVAGMFLMIGTGVYELVMADGEMKAIKRLLKN